QVVASLSGIPREALEGLLRGNESDAITRALTLDAATLKTLPRQTVEAMSSVLFDFAIETAPDPPAATPGPAAPPTFDATAKFTGEVWSPDAAEKDSFLSFYALFGR